MRKEDVAQAAGVDVEAVRAVGVTEVRRALCDAISSIVLDVATQEPAFYWQAGGRYWLDDVFFGDVVAFDQLAYHADLGLHVQGQVDSF